MIRWLVITLLFIPNIYAQCDKYTADPEELVLLPTTRSEMANSPAAVMIRRPQSCPMKCLFDLKTYTLKDTKSVFIMKGAPYDSGIAPFGYKLQTEFACAREPGACGASVPIYRSVQLTGKGLQYSYLSDNKMVFGYVTDIFPICYAWKQPKSVVAEGTKTLVVDDKQTPDQEPSNSNPTPLKTDPAPAPVPSASSEKNGSSASDKVSDPTETKKTTDSTAEVGVKPLDVVANCSAVDDQPDVEDLVLLREFYNDKSAQMTDHYMTTMDENRTELEGYRYMQTIGKVLINDSSCPCLKTLEQRMDDQPLLGRLDHKLAVKGEEPNRPIELYNPTGEIVYCARQYGDCGATVPLYKHYMVLEGDSIMMTTNITSELEQLYPKEPLCFIWKTDFLPESFNSTPATTTQNPTEILLDEMFRSPEAPGTITINVTDERERGAMRVVNGIVVRDTTGETESGKVDLQKEQLLKPNKEKALEVDETDSSTTSKPKKRPCDEETTD